MKSHSQIAQDHVTPRFRYRSLPDERHVRLIELLPARGTQDLEVRICLHIFSLDALPSYEALSYFWGGEMVENLVICEGFPITVPGTAYECLLHLRTESPREFLWVDAICINQKDTSEKSHTIPFLHELSIRANRVVAWLGMPLLPSVSTLLESSQQFKIETVMEERGITSLDPYHVDCKVTSHDLELFESDSRLHNQKAWDALNDILESPYFTRAWIFLDWINSSDLVLRFESDYVSWDTFCALLESCFYFSTTKCPSSAALMNVVVSRRLQHGYRSETGLNMKEVVRARQLCKLNAANPRDHIFSLFAVIRHEDGPSLRLDYASKVEEAYLDIAIYIGLESLSFVDHSFPSSFDLPSWAPDWSAQRKIFQLDHPNSDFTASSVQPVACRFSLDRDVAKVEGVILDTIKDVSQYLPPRRHCDHYNVEGINNITFTQWFEFAQQRKRRLRHDPGYDTRLLVEFANTIQAKGCRSIWESQGISESEELACQMRTFLDFLETEGLDLTFESRLFYAACLPAHGRRLGITRKGHLCLIPKNTKPEDLVFVPHGGRIPLIFQKAGEEYTNLGECYVNDCMKADSAAIIKSQVLKVK